MKTCTDCGTPKELDQFAKHPKGAGGLDPSCKDCNNAYARAWRAKRRAVVEKLLRGIFDPYQCLDCGNTDHRTFQFHHEGKKEFKISDGMSGKYPIAKMLEEIKKCVLLCANCHMIRHSD